MKKQKTGNNGFTLAELLIVVAIIGVLVAISMPVFAGHLEKSRETVDLANVRSAYSEVMTAVMTEDTANYSRTVKLKQKRDNWNAYDPVTVAGITHSRDEVIRSTGSGSLLRMENVRCHIFRISE